MKNKKGFTLIELLVSFALITVVSISLFRTVLAVQKKAQKDISYNQYIAFAATFNNAIELDFTNNTIISVAPCGQNCYDIIYSDAGTKRFSIDRNNNSVMYGTIKEKLPSYYEFDGDIKIELDTAYSAPSNAYNSVAKLVIPLKSNLLSFSQDLKYVYQYDSRVHDIAQTLYTTLTINPSGGKYDGSTSNKVYNILPGQTINILTPTDKAGNVFEKWNFTGSGSYSNGVFTASTGDAVITAGWLTYANMYTYTGTSQIIDDGSNNWRIKFLTDGTFSMKVNMSIDAFVLGGGAPGLTSSNYPGGVGGNGGGCSSGTISLTALTTYSIDIGDSNLNSTAFSLTGTTGAGASGAAGGHWYYNYPGGTGGTGTCYAFGDTSIPYGGGGGGGGSRGDNTDYELGGAGGNLGGGHGGDRNGNGVSGTANTGGGGGGGGSGGFGGEAGIGGSGIVIIRNHR